MRSLVAALGALASCSIAEPVTSNGISIDEITIGEQCALYRPIPELHLRDRERLQRAVELLERHRRLETRGRRAGLGVLDGCSVSLVINPGGKFERAVEVTNCHDERLCPFLDDAKAAGIYNRRLFGACLPEERRQPW